MTKDVHPKAVWNKGHWLCAAFAAAGVLMVLASLGLTLRTSAWLKATRHVQGTITAIKEDASSPGMFHPVYSATTEEGDPFQIVGSVAASPPPRIGTNAVLAYPPGQPQNASVVGLLGVWFAPLLIAAIGMLWTFIALAILFFSTSPRPPSTPRA